MSARRTGAVVAAAALATLGACRAIVGVEDLTLVDAGGRDGAPTDATTDASGDVVGADAPADATADTASSCGDKGIDCLKCCRDTHRDHFKPLEDRAVADGCVCGAAVACASQCGPSLCASQLPDMNCVPCLDQRFTRSAPNDSKCNQAANECAADNTCKPVIDCLRSCP